MARRLKEGIINAFHKYCEYPNTEIPGLFVLWVAISTISSVLGRDCFIDQGYFVVYPNLYVVLVAGSAWCKKSTAIMLSYNALKSMSNYVNILSQKMTPEALIGALSNLEAKDAKTIITDASGVAIVDELSTLIDMNSFKSGLISVLTKLYDCTDFEYMTRKMGIEYVRNSCISILGGSTIEWIRESVPKVAIGGGFTSRVVFVFQNEPSGDVAWPKLNEENQKRWEDIIHDLDEVAVMRGSFSLTPEALKLYELEYSRFKSDSVLATNRNLSGYAGRRHVTVLKVSMVMAASRNDKRLIEEHDVKNALIALSFVERAMPQVLQSISAEFVGNVCEEVLFAIVNRGTIPRSELISQMKNKLTSAQLDVIVTTLVEEKVVQVSEREGNIEYKFVGKKK